MAGIGASFLLIISNLKNILSEFERFEVKIIIGLLLLSLAFGIIEKVLFIIISQNVKIITQINTYISANKEKIDDADLKSATLIFNKRVTRWYHKKKIEKYSSQVAINNNDFIVDLGKRYNMQVEFSVAMISTAFIAIIFVLIFL